MANRKRNVSYVNQEEPAFLKRFKERIGYKDGPTIESKQQNIPDFDETDDRSDTEEDLPTVVVLRDGDLTAEEADAALNYTKNADGDAEGESEGRVIFRKPVKHTSDRNSDFNASTNTRNKDSEAATGKDNNQKGKKKKKLNNTKLLSFDTEEQD